MNNINLCKDQETLYGDIFVVPSYIIVCDDQRKLQNMLQYYNIKNLKGPQVCFEMCIANNECTNWNAYIYEKIGFITSWMPIELFIGKREGDKIELLINNKSKMIEIKKMFELNVYFEQFVN